MFSPDGALLASINHETARVWRCADGACVLEVEGGSEVAFSADGSALLTLGSRRLRAFAVDSGQLIDERAVDEGRPGGALAVSPWNHIAVMVGDELRLWDPFLDGEPVASVELRESRALAFSNDGRIVAGSATPSGSASWRASSWARR